jgi:hypothetical protein
LHGYAERGALRQLEEHSARGKTTFQFTWLLDRRFTVVVDPTKSRMEIKDLLPNVPARSDLDRAVRAFVASRSDRRLPAHRRVDPGRVEISCANRKSALSFIFVVKRNQYKYATAKALNFCNELFSFLDLHHIQYLWEHLGLPEE